MIVWIEENAQFKFLLEFFSENYSISKFCSQKSNESIEDILHANAAFLEGQRKFQDIKFLILNKIRQRDDFRIQISSQKIFIELNSVFVSLNEFLSGFAPLEERFTKRTWNVAGLTTEKLYSRMRTSPKRVDKNQKIWRLNQIYSYAIVINAKSGPVCVWFVENNLKTFLVS